MSLRRLGGPGFGLRGRTDLNANNNNISSNTSSNLNNTNRLHTPTASSSTSNTSKSSAPTTPLISTSKSVPNGRKSVLSDDDLDDFDTFLGKDESSDEEWSNTKSKNDLEVARQKVENSKASIKALENEKEDSDEEDWKNSTINFDEKKKKDKDKDKGKDKDKPLMDSFSNDPHSPDSSLDSSFHYASMYAKNLGISMDSSVDSSPRSLHESASSSPDTKNIVNQIMQRYKLDLEEEEKSEKGLLTSSEKIYSPESLERSTDSLNKSTEYSSFEDDDDEISPNAPNTTFLPQSNNPKKTLETEYPQSRPVISTLDDDNDNIITSNIPITSSPSLQPHFETKTVDIKTPSNIQKADTNSEITKITLFSRNLKKIDQLKPISSISSTITPQIETKTENSEKTLTGTSKKPIDVDPKKPQPFTAPSPSININISPQTQPPTKIDDKEKVNKDTQDDLEAPKVVLPSTPFSKPHIHIFQQQTPALSPISFKHNLRSSMDNSVVIEELQGAISGAIKSKDSGSNIEQEKNTIPEEIEDVSKDTKESPIRNSSEMLRYSTDFFSDDEREEKQKILGNLESKKEEDAPVNKMLGEQLDSVDLFQSNSTPSKPPALQKIEEDDKKKDEKENDDKEKKDDKTNKDKDKEKEKEKEKEKKILSDSSEDEKAEMSFNVSLTSDLDLDEVQTPNAPKINLKKPLQSPKSSIKTSPQPPKDNKKSSNCCTSQKNFSTTTKTKRVAKNQRCA